METIIIGAGIIGLAAAERLSRSGGNILCVEKEPDFGRHCSSRNSEVIHSGIYYQPDSLKAALCVEGNRALYSFLMEREISHRRCGKLVVAVTEEEVPALEALKEKGERNGVEELKILSGNEAMGMEPSLKAHAALLVPSTGIFDSHSVMRELERMARENGVLFAYDTEVTAIHPQPAGYRLSFGQEFEMETIRIINCAGLWSDRICEMAGMNVETAGYKLHWNKGDYFKTSRYRNFQRLIYPLPDPKGIHLGIHTVSNLQGELSFGPNSYYVSELDYKPDDSRRRSFVTAVRRYLDIDDDDVWPDMSGIRPKLQGPGDPERDFVIREET
ncbi:MAG: NAD(P)/FAD-dependent oxidoreductase, partial [Candidatus Aminicenantes bacterium]|nr:NAD(P)/FAD-dependent oxidoreductase [Candidatus Aminicenantes bacterium]